MNAKQHNPLVSLVIPVYNIKDYLSICIESILNQTYENFEVILIDDGSKDGSSELCDSFKDKRIRVLHQENMGVSTARNVGLQHAKGEAVMFVDGDDFLDLQMIEQLVRRFTADIDIVSCRYVSFHEGEQPKALFSDDDEIVSGTDAVNDLLYQRKIVNGPFGKLYRRSLFDTVAFHKDIAFAEDLLMNFEVIEKSRKVIVSNAAFYFYLLRKDSAINKKFSQKRMDGIKAVERILELSKDKPVIMNAAKNRAFMEASFIIMALPLFSSVNKQNFRDCIKVIRTLRGRVASDAASPSGYRILGKVAKISIGLFVILVKLKAAQPRVRMLLKRVMK